MSKHPSVISENVAAALKLSMNIWFKAVSLFSFTLLSMEFGFHKERVSSIALKMLSIPCLISDRVTILFRLAILSSKW